MEATLKCQGVKREKFICYLPPGNQLHFTFQGISPLNFTLTPPWKTQSDHFPFRLLGKNRNISHRCMISWRAIRGCYKLWSFSSISISHWNLQEHQQRWYVGRYFVLVIQCIVNLILFSCLRSWQKSFCSLSLIHFLTDNWSYQALSHIVQQGGLLHHLQQVSEKKSLQRAWIFPLSKTPKAMIALNCFNWFKIKFYISKKFS